MVVIVTTVIVLLSSRALENSGSGARKLSVLGDLKRRNILFQPNDLGAGDDELKRYFSAEVENDVEAQRLIDQLLGHDEVEAAWVKPKDEPPK